MVLECVPCGRSYDECCTHWRVQRSVLREKRVANSNIGCSSRVYNTWNILCTCGVSGTRKWTAGWVEIYTCDGCQQRLLYS